MRLRFCDHGRMPAPEVNRAMLRVRDAIDRAYDPTLDVDGAGPDRLHVSPDHLIRTFRPVFGETPHRYLQRRRVERAMFLLRTTDLRASPTSASRVGFTSLGTFSRHVLARSSASRPTAYARGADRCPPCPACFTMAWTRPSTFTDPISPSVSEKRDACALAFGDMTSPTPRLSSLYVLDQDQALDFDVGDLGLEVGTDADLGFMRWLTVQGPRRRPGDPARAPRTARPRPGRPPSRSASCSPRAPAGGWIALPAPTTSTRLLRRARRTRASRSPSRRPTSPTGATSGSAIPFGNHLRIGRIPVP